jgi:4-diphosphocytidyl-2-C-methyl-D-erythritol kinase
MICFPNAKINLGLHIINKRTDGFHNIETVFYPVGFSDMLECVENRKYSAPHKCSFISNGLHISGDAQHNLVVKAYHILDELFDLPPVLVYLNKIIPMGAGLGGGSSDAAFMLKMLNDLFGLKQTPEQLENYAAQLGSDCAFFIRNQPSYLFGKGHELVPFGINLSGLYLVMVNTGAHSNTAMAYNNALRREVYNENNNLQHILARPIEMWKQDLENDFERSVFHALPELAKVKNWLYAQGAIYAAMSGSGASLFGLFDRKPSLNGKWKDHVIFNKVIRQLA